MAQKGSNSKKQRTHKVSKGINGGGGKTTLNEVEKALLGGGRVAGMRPTPVLSPYRGERDPRLPLFDPAQAEHNIATMSMLREWRDDD